MISHRQTVFDITPEKRSKHAAARRIVSRNRPGFVPHCSRESSPARMRERSIQSFFVHFERQTFYFFVWNPFAVLSNETRDVTQTRDGFELYDASGRNLTWPDLTRTRIHVNIVSPRQAWRRRRIRSTRRASRRPAAARPIPRPKTWWSCDSSSRRAPTSRWPPCRPRRTPCATTITCWWGARCSATCTRASSATRCSRRRTAWKCIPGGRTTARGRSRASCATNRSAPR